MDKINSSIGQDPDATNIIGVLDIYGFESFKINRSAIVLLFFILQVDCAVLSISTSLLITEK